MNLFRIALERFSRNLVLKKHLGHDLNRAPLLVSPDAMLSYWKPGIHSDLFDFAKEFVHPGSVTWDIGANVGLFSVAAGQRASSDGKVVAVEADIWLAQLLQRTVSMQPVSSSSIQVIPAAVYSELGIASFNIARRGRASNFLASAGGNSQSGGTREQVSVVTVTLDWLFERFPAPNVLKIDVEGAELDVLKGGLRVLAEARPVVLCEVTSRLSEQVTEIFKRQRYVLYDWDAQPRKRVTSACFNTLAIPISD